MTALYDGFALLLEYPGPDFARVAGATCIALEQDLRREADAACGDILPFIHRFCEGVQDRSKTDLEELYTVTFDLNPVCSLDLGWHLFGENYDRGAFLVTMRERLREYGIGESSELPDHLPLVLRLLGRLPEEEASALAAQTVIPALNKMLEGFREEANPYRFLLDAVGEFVVSRHTQEKGA